MEINHENHREIYEALKDFYIAELDEFAYCHGGITKASAKIRASRSSFEKGFNRSIENLADTYRRCREYGYDRSETIHADEIMARTGWSNSKVDEMAKIGKFERISPKKSIFVRRSAEVILADIEERKRIAGIK